MTWRTSSSKKTCATNPKGVPLKYLGKENRGEPDCPGSRAKWPLKLRLIGTVKCAMHNSVVWVQIGNNPVRNIVQPFILATHKPGVHMRNSQCSSSLLVRLYILWSSCTDGILIFRAGMSPLPGGRWHGVIPCGMWVPVVVRCVANGYTWLLYFIYTALFTRMYTGREHEYKQ